MLFAYINTNFDLSVFVDSRIITYLNLENAVILEF